MHVCAKKLSTVGVVLSNMSILARRRGFARSARAKEILDAVKRGIERDPKTVPPLTVSAPMSAEANATVELLKVLLKAAAARHRVAPRLIADNDELEQIASETAADVRTLTGWRRIVFRVQQGLHARNDGTRRCLARLTRDEQ